MLPADIPDPRDLLDLMDHRDPASVSIAVESSPMPADHERVRIALRNAIDSAHRELSATDIAREAVDAVIARLRGLLDDPEFWDHQSRSLIVFASTERLETFRIANHLIPHVSVGDRFDTGALLRAVAFDYRAYIVLIDEGQTRLFEFGPDHRPAELALDLPEDHHLALEKTTTGGRFDRRRADGRTGDQPERERYARIAQDAVTARIPRGAPLVLAASDDLEPAYRAVNTHGALLDTTIPVHPQALGDPARLAAEVRTILDDHHAAELARWREDFGTLRSDGRATSKLTDAARAATEAAVDTLAFDMDETTEGTIDEFGRVAQAAEPGPGTYTLVDEVAARVLRSGGTVRAVRRPDLPDGAPVAATLRFPIDPA